MAASERFSLPKPIKNTLTTSIRVLIVTLVLWIVFFKLFHAHYDITVHISNGKGSK